MYQLITWILATGNWCQKALIDQLFQADTRLIRVAVTRSASAARIAGDSPSLIETAKDTFLVLCKPCAAIADELFFDEHTDCVGPSGHASLVKGLNNRFNIRIGFAKRNLFGRSLRCSGRLRKPTLIQFAA